MKHSKIYLRRRSLIQRKKKYLKAKKFLWTVRSHLHILSERPNEQLNFEYQSLIAKKIGYKKTKALLHVEKFMKDYFFTAKRVSDLIRIYCTLIEDKEKLIPGLKIKKSKEIKINNFVIGSNLWTTEFIFLYLENLILSMISSIML